VTDKKPKKNKKMFADKPAVLSVAIFDDKIKVDF
jgi:hypothetical protein